MSEYAETLADELLKPQKPVKAGELADSLLEGHQAAASQLLQSDFQSGVYASPGLRWSLARGDTLEEKRRRIKKKYPDGEIDVLPESIVMGFDEDTLVWRESPQVQWKMVEPQGFDKFDIIEAIAPSAESIAGEAALAIGTKGLSVPMTVARQAMGAIAGEAVEQTVQYSRGLQAQSPTDIALEVGAEGALSAAGGFAMSPLAATYNIIRGAGALRVGDEGIDVMRAANALDEDLIGRKLTPGLVTDNPTIKLQEKQASALLPSFRRRYRQMLIALDTAVRSSAPGNAMTAMRDVVRALQDFSDHFLSQVKRADITLSKGGKALQDGIEVYSKQSKIAVDDLYDVARSIEEPAFNLKPFYEVAADIQAGAKGIYDKSLNGPLSELHKIKGPKELPSGKILSVSDQIRNVRTQLWDLKQIKPGELPTQANGQANDLYNALTDVLKNPTNADPAFIKAWQAASDAAALRSSTLERAAVMTAAKSEAPLKLARSLIRPGEADNLLALRGAVPEKYWKQFVDAAYGEILKDPSKSKQVLDAFDQETLDTLIPRNEQALLRKVVKELDRIYGTNTFELAETQVKNRNFVDRVITEFSPRDTYTLIRAANNTNNRQMRESLRAAIVEWAWDGVVVAEKGGLRANESVLKTHVKQLKKSGLWSILSSSERKIISNATIVSRAFQSVADAGTSIQAAEAAKYITRLKASAIHSFVQYGIVSQLYLSRMGRQMLIGSGLPNSNAAMLRVFGGALTQVSRPEDISALVEDKD